MLNDHYKTIRFLYLRFLLCNPTTTVQVSSGPVHIALWELKLRKLAQKFLSLITAFVVKNELSFVSDLGVSCQHP